jgi:hypothetical protein
MVEDSQPTALHVAIDAAVAAARALLVNRMPPGPLVPKRAAIGYRYSGTISGSVGSVTEEWPDLDAFVDRWPLLVRLPEVQRLTGLVQFVASDPRRPWVSPPDGVVFPSPPRFDVKSPESIACAMIGLGLAYQESGVEPDVFARDTVEDLAACAGKTILLHDYRAYLENFDAEDGGPFDFGLGMKLRKLTEHERSVIATEQSGSYQTGAPALTFDSFALRMMNIGWVLESRAPYPSQIVLEGEPTPHYEIFSGPPFGSVVTLFRLTGEGFPYIGLVTGAPVSWLYPGKMCQSQPRVPSSPFRMPYRVSADQLHQMARLWNRSARVAFHHPTGWWDTSLLRFNMSYGRAVVQDQLVDLCVCLEACMSSPRESGKGGKIARRATHLLGSSREGLMDAIEDGFAARNRLLHAQPYPDLTGIVQKLRWATRTILARILEIGAWNAEAPLGDSPGGVAN